MRFQCLVKHLASFWVTVAKFCFCTTILAMQVHVSLTLCVSCGQQQQQQQQPFYGPLSGTTWVSLHQKKHSLTHHPDHHPIFISFFHLPRSIASSLFKLRAWQSLQYLFPCPLWSTSWSGALHLIFHTFLHPISVFFSQHMPIPLQPVLL